MTGSCFYSLVRSGPQFSTFCRCTKSTLFLTPLPQLKAYCINVDTFCMDILYSRTNTWIHFKYCKKCTLWCLYCIVGMLWVYHFDAFEAVTLKGTFLHTLGIGTNLMYICKRVYTHHGNNMFLAIFNVLIQNHPTTGRSNSRTSLLGIHHSLRGLESGDVVHLQRQVFSMSLIRNYVTDIKKAAVVWGRS